LCSAGYFEALMKMIKETNLNEFSELYESIVGKGALTIFVSDSKTPNQLTQEVVRRIKTDRNYGGAGIIQIHGIGRNNIDTIKISLDDIQDAVSNLDINTSLKNRVMVVTIKF
ncbi:MAG: hypothetical protein V1862_05590, partial [Methanobacteriota archaeon]